MEAVNNMASAASRAIWGEKDGANTAQNEGVSNETKGQEPLSGEMGDVSKGEPYDKGNAGEPTSTDTTTSPGGPKTSTQPDAPGNTPASKPIRPEHDTDKTGVTSAHNPTSATASDKPTSSNDNSGPGAAPSVSADPSSAQQNTQKQQGADRPSEEPSNEEHERIKETKKEAEDAAAVDTSGPGPRSLEEKARDGGNISGDKAGEEEDGPQKESKGEGTGEQYVKSSGMVADGGDFDAANPGAGKEADRLLEQKGIHHEPGAKKPPAGKEETGGAEDAKSSKPKLSEKIKAKLHIGKDKD